MNLSYSEEAVIQLSAIRSRIAIDHPKTADAFVEALLDKADSIVGCPERGRLVPELGDRTIREIIHKKYRIVYRLNDEGITILTVFEGHRLLRNIDLA